MSLTAFDKFVQQEQQNTKDFAGTFDPIKVKEEWLKSLQDLYTLVAKYLESYIAAGQIEISYRSITLNEEQLEPYQAPEMLIRIGTKTVLLEPVGTFLIGSRGRVDVIGPYARTRLLLVDPGARRSSDMVPLWFGANGKPPSAPCLSGEPMDWAWRMITRPPELKFVKLTKEAFLNMLLEIANG